MSSCPLFSLTCRIKERKQSPGVIKIMCRCPLFSLKCCIKVRKQSPGVIKIFRMSSCPSFSLEEVRHRIYYVIFLLTQQTKSHRQCMTLQYRCFSKTVSRRQTCYMVLVSQKQPLEYDHHAPICLAADLFADSAKSSVSRDAAAPPLIYLRSL